MTVSQDDDGRIWLDQVPKGIMVEMGGQPERNELVHYEADSLIPVKADRGMYIPHAFVGDDGHGRALYLHVGRAIRRADSPPGQRRPRRGLRSRRRVVQRGASGRSHAQPPTMTAVDPAVDRHGVARPAGAPRVRTPGPASRRAVSGVSLVSLWVLITASFLMIHLIPGDPVRGALGLTAPPALVASTREALGLNDPLLGPVRGLPAGPAQR